jgi:hypothetical protein
VKNLTIVLENRPGALAEACEAMGHAGINLEGISCFASQGIALLYAAVEDAVAARQAAERIGLKVSEERDVLACKLHDRPGSAAAVLRRIGNAGINVELAYVLDHNRLLLGTNDQEKAAAILHGIR